MTTYTTTAVGVFLALMLSGPVTAADYGSAQEGVYEHPTFSHLDIDRDGVLSKAEAAGRKGLLSYWQRTDINGDNVIERSEFAAFETLPSIPPAPLVTEPAAPSNR